MKPQNKITLEQLALNNYNKIAEDNKGIEVYHSYTLEKGLVIKKVNQEYKIDTCYSLKDCYNKEYEL